MKKWRIIELVVDNEAKENTNQILKEILTWKSITKLTDIQKKAYPYLFSDDNLIIVAPSGAGKTLIAEMVAIRDIMNEWDSESNIYISGHENRFDNQLSSKNFENVPAKTIFLVPLRALAEEKASNFAKDYRHLKVKIHMSMSEIDFNEEEIRKCNILISTYERFRTILGRMPDLVYYTKNVIIDEFHLLGDKKRGPILETILTTIIDKVRLILLSATIANPKDIADWLRGVLLVSEERHIPLEYSILTSLDPYKQISKKIDYNIKNDSQLLVFCGTRSKAEEFAEDFSQFIFTRAKQKKDFDPGKVLAFLESISLPNDTLGNKQLYELMQKGTAFHHAGLSRITKKVVEELFRQKLVKVLFCTETLGAGVNLPAREVVIVDTKRWNNEWLSRNVFHQIAGRAGRPDYDFYGNCSILANDTQEKGAILNRFWESNIESKNTFSSEINAKPRFDEISSMILTKDEFEKLILTLIYSNKPTQKELIQLLKRTFLDFKMMKMLKRNVDNEIDIDYFSEVYFKTLVETGEDFEKEKLSALELYYQIDNLEISKTIEGEISQVIYVKENECENNVSLKQDEFTCSCTHNDLFCKHRLLVLKQLPKVRVKRIIDKEFSFLSKLQKHNYVIETAKGKMNTTIKGSICAEMGITREKFEYLKDWLMLDLFAKKPSLSQLLFECQKIAPVVEDSDYFIDILSFKRPIYEHVILGRDMLSVIRKHQLYEGDLLRIEVSIKSIISGLAPLAEYLGLTDISKNFESLDKILSEVLRLSF